MRNESVHHFMCVGALLARHKLPRVGTCAIDSHFLSSSTMYRKRRDIPALLKPFYFDFHWSQKKLWELDLPAQKMRMSDFEWILDYPVWATDPPFGVFDLSPRQMLGNPSAYPDHLCQIEKADTSCPIHVMFWKDRWMIMDGFHRFIKLMEKGVSEIHVYQVSTSKILSIQPDSNGEHSFLKYELMRKDLV